MYLLLNRDEVVIELARWMLKHHLKKIKPTWNNVNQYLDEIKLQRSKSRLLEIDFARVNKLLFQDLHCYYKDDLIGAYKKKYRPLINWLVANFDRINIDHKRLIDLHVKSNTKHFVKSIGLQLTRDPVWAIGPDTEDRVPHNTSVLIRNVANNHQLLQKLLLNKLHFWFIDSGYTNFITGQKKWHRLVKNHVHHSPIKTKYYPADRLNLLSQLPTPWRKTGDRILVVENSHQHHEMVDTNLEVWREQVRQQLLQHTDRKIEFRPKDLNRKNRSNLYELLKNTNYYCVVTEASAAAIEAVWAGTPIITLGYHISTPVARTSLSDINDLYRGPIGDWLCALSYSQFTIEEMFDGTALKAIKRHHA